MSALLAQPTDHCPCDSPEASKHLLSVEQAQTVALELTSPIRRQELVTLAEALGRVVAKDLHAPRAMPFFNNSAMDGYAVSTTDLTGKGSFKLVIAGESAAGSSKVPMFQEMGCIRVFTGAPIPRGFDAVIAQENCKIEQGCIVFEHAPETGNNIRFQGSDMERGACLIKKGTKIQPHHIGLLAANGYSAINVIASPRVAVLSTGDELAPPGQELKSGQIFDSNKPMLSALLASMGIDVIDLGSVPDNAAATSSLFSSIKNTVDLVISTGSVSVGDRDYLKGAFIAAGGTIKNWKVAIKPGKPVMFGSLGDTIFTGLPGNPFAVFVGFELFAKPQVSRLCGHIPHAQPWITATADFSWKRKIGRTEVFPVRLAGSGVHEKARLVRLGNSSSGTLFPLAEADGLGMVPSHCSEVGPGDQIEWHPFCQD